MKSYSHLWEKLIDPETIKLAIRKSARRKKDRPRVYYIYNHQDDFVEYYTLYAASYIARQRPAKIILDGHTKKERKITVPTFDEQVLMNMIIIVLEPIITKELYPHVHGSIPRRGCHKAKKQIEKWLKKDIKGTKYFYKCDIRKFFDSINHQFLKMFLEKKIKDWKFLRLLFQIIDCTDVGVPLGFPTSHWFAHWYIADVDYYIMNKFRPAHYIRYVDDIVIFDRSKKILHLIHNKLNLYLLKHILFIKKNYQICKFLSDTGRVLDFMGYKFYRIKTLLRKTIMFRFVRMSKVISKRNLTIYDARRCMSMLGYIKSTNTYDMYKENIKPFVNFGDCKKYISFYDRRKIV